MSRSHPLQCIGSSQPQSKSLPRTPSPRPVQNASDSSLSSMSSGSTVRAVPLDNPFVTRQTSISTTRQSSHTTGFQCPLDASVRLPDTQPSPTSSSLRFRKTNDTYGPINSLRSHDNRMARSQMRQPEPQSREDSPTLPTTRTPNASFSARVARLPTQGSPTAHKTLQQPTFLDEDSSASSDDGANHRHGDSGYISTLTTPAKPNNPKIGSAASPTIQTALIPAPLVFDRPPKISSAQVDAPSSVSRRAEPLCDPRHCLRHRQTCLEHAPTALPLMRPSRIPQSRTQDRRLRRRARVRESRSFEGDVWMRIAPEFPLGS